MMRKLNIFPFISWLFAFEKKLCSTLKRNQKLENYIKRIVVFTLLQILFLIFTFFTALKTYIVKSLHIELSARCECESGIMWRELMMRD